MYRKIVGLFIFMLLIVTVLPVSGTVDLESNLLPQLFGNILYVGGSGPGNYSSIQDAIDNASDEDTIFVYKGCYESDDNIKINKTIRLIGEDKEDTVIYRNLIDIVVSNVYISGFTLLNGSDITIQSTSSIISNNNKIHDNIFKSNESLYGMGGISIYNSSNNIVSNNSFFNCGILMDVFDVSCQADSKNNSIYNNTVDDKPLVYFEYDSDEIIYNAGQIILYHCKNITINSLEISYTSIGIQLIDCDNCHILRCELTNNLLGGMAFNNVSNSSISGNIIKNGALGTTLVNSRNNSILNNSFENKEINIFLYYSSFNKISHNNFFFKFSYGLWRFKSILSFESNNKWEGNYWNRFRLFPVFVWNLYSGYYYQFNKRFDIDWHPAKEPYDI